MTTSRPPPDFDDAERLVERLRQVVIDLKESAGRDLAALAQRVQELEADAHELQQLLQASERQAAQLENLYVAVYQLHGSLALDDVRRAIAEIAINLLGAERFVILVRDEEHARFDVTSHPHPEPDDGPLAGPTYEGGDRLIDAALSYGVVRFGPLTGSSAVAVVPMMIEGKPLGALVILRLRPHKTEFAIEDRELLEVLAAHAASALMAATVFAERSRKLRTLEGLMPPALGPDDRRGVIAGSLIDIGFPDLIQFLHMSGRSGTLYLEHDGEAAHISFHAGRIASAWCPNTITVVEYLDEAGQLREEDLERARAIQAAQPRRTLGEVLLTMGAIRPEHLRAAVAHKMEQSVFELVSWRRGSFRFVVEEVRYDEELLFAPEEIVPRVELDTQVVLMEALRLLDERSRDSRPLGAQAAQAIAEAAARADGASSQLPGRTAPAPPAAVLWDTVVGLRRLLREMVGGEDGARTFLNLMAFVAQHADRGVLLSVRRDHLVALTGFGRCADGTPLADAIRGLRIVFEAGGSIALGFDARCAVPLDWDVDEVPEGLRAILGRPATGQAALFPIMSNRRRIAILYADTGDKLDDSLALDVLELATGQFGLAIENEILRRQIER